MRMKLAVLLGALWLATGTAAGQAPAVSPLRVLYVGPASTPMPGNGESDAGGGRQAAFRAARAPSFEKFLRQHFKTVKVIEGPAFKESMSAGYDVTIFDALPPVTAPQIYERDAQGRTLKFEPAHYLTAKFDRAAILISDVSSKISEPLRYKSDHYCLCLDSTAVGMKLDHPIFNTPNKVKVTIEYRATPENYRGYYSGRNLPDQLPVWRVQKEGYADGKGFPPGLVSTGEGYAGPDAEAISSGFCTKDINATALGRHGNFFHWGFNGNPDDMTEEGRQVFINTIHYMSKYNGQLPYSHRQRRVFTRDMALHVAYLLQKSDYDQWAAQEREKFKSQQDYLRQSQQAGRTLTADELKTLSAAVPTLPPRETWLQQQRIWELIPQSLKTKFGTELYKYLPYVEANLEYLVPGGQSQQFEVDEDVRSLAASNRSVETLELCVAMLESNLDAEKAQRILTRYTDQKFQSAQEWRAWLYKNRGHLYFSDVDGYRFHVAPVPVG